MLGGVEDYIIKKLLEEYYSNDESKDPYVDYIGSVPTKINPTLAISYGIDVKSDKQQDVQVCIVSPTCR